MKGQERLTTRMWALADCVQCCTAIGAPEIQGINLDALCRKGRDTIMESHLTPLALEGRRAHFVFLIALRQMWNALCFLALACLLIGHQPPPEDNGQVPFRHRHSDGVLLDYHYQPFVT